MMTSATGERKRVQLNYHQTNSIDEQSDEHRDPTQIPIIIFIDDENCIMEILCDNDNVQAEVFIYDEFGNIMEYFPYLNVITYLPSSPYSIIIKGDGWYAESLSPNI